MSTSATTSPPALDEVSILVIDDEPALTEVMAVALGSRQFKVTVATNGEQALAAATVDPPDIVVLDLGLPDIDGIDVCRQLRRWFANPIIVLSADGAESRKVEALDAGADDYVTKPFSPREIVARVKAILRRTAAPQHSPAPPSVIAVGNVEVDLGRREARVDRTPVALATREFDLLAYLAANQGLALSRRQLLDGVWGDGWIGDDRTVDVHVRQLRKKLGDGFPLDTVWGVGYRLG
mgnify:CR=1 FL=1